MMNRTVAPSPYLSVVTPVWNEAPLVADAVARAAASAAFKELIAEARRSLE